MEFLAQFPKAGKNRGMSKKQLKVKIRASITLLSIFGILAFFNCQTGSEFQSQPELPLLASFDFEDGSTAAWSARNPDNWQIAEEKGNRFYELIEPGEQGEVRAPAARSVLTEFDVSSFVFNGRLRCYTGIETINRDMCVYFLCQDPTHFAYVHYSARSDGVHNIIGLVKGADRVKINAEPAGESIARLVDQEWHDFKVTFDAATGMARAYLDDMSAPILSAHLTAFTHGCVGVGSFDDTGAFDDLVLRGIISPVK
jgi:hypothetical protein